MTDASIILYMAVEGRLDEALLRTLLRYTGRSFNVRAISCGGCEELRKKANTLNHSAKGVAVLVLTDLDRNECAPTLIRDWFTAKIHPNFLFRVAVRSIESWLLADREVIAQFLKVPEKNIPTDVESLDRPKQTLVNLARKSRIKAIVEDIVPPERSTSHQGPGYNLRMMEFIQKNWNIEKAAEQCDSLRRTIAALRKFKPDFSASAR